MCPAWELRERGDVTTWLSVRLHLPGGGQVDVLAVVSGDRVAIEEVRAQPPLCLDDLVALADRIEEPLLTVCGLTADLPPAPAEEPAPGLVSGAEGVRRIAEEYLAARSRGADPVSAVMGVTGRSRRQCLKLIGGARDAGYLPPRHARR
ncbi:DUF6214 family protein [Streptomyces sp. NPDC048664]|uniref:DUF6214 family protein n=1 Tax=Streptomyces sp. NPDC048664 TaxID=3154505 RepID=UPI00342398E4